MLTYSLSKAKVKVSLAYLSACGKYLQLLMHGAFWLEPPLT